MKKKGSFIWLWLSVLLIGLPEVLALEMLDRVWQRVVWIGDLGFLNITNEAAVVALMRILIGFLVFTIFFAVIRMMEGGGTVGFLKKNQAVVVAAILALISSIFVPAEAILGIGAAWGTMVAFLLIGLPIVGLAFLLWQIPWDDEETRWTVFLKLFLCLVLFWVLSAIKNHVGGML